MRVKGWKQIFAAIEIEAAPTIFPLATFNPRYVSVYARLLGMKMRYKRESDGFHVWRLE